MICNRCAGDIHSRMFGLYQNPVRLSNSRTFFGENPLVFVSGGFSSLDQRRTLQSFRRGGCLRPGIVSLLVHSSPFRRVLNSQTYHLTVFTSRPFCKMNFILTFLRRNIPRASLGDFRGSSTSWPGTQTLVLETQDRRRLRSSETQESPRVEGTDFFTRITIDGVY